MIDKATVIFVKYMTMSAFFSNQSFANVVCRLLSAVCRLLNTAKVETNTSFNQSWLTLFDMKICIHMLLVNKLIIYKTGRESTPYWW